VNAVGGSEARVRAVTIAGAILINFGYLIAMETLTRGRNGRDVRARSARGAR
jgi:hypothetical protein